MRETEQTARTVEEAIQQGLHLLDASRDEVEVEILDEPSGGFLGLGAKQARVRVMVRELDTEKAKSILEGVLERLGLSAHVDVVQNGNTVRFEVSGEDLGILIGKRGQTLNAMQFLLGVFLMRGMKGQKINCSLDVEGYRVRREKSLQALAERMAKKASMERRDVVLEPMLPHERRIIHMALENNPYVTTSSQGKDPMRKVVISPKAGARPRARGPKPREAGFGARGGIRSRRAYPWGPNRGAAERNLERPQSRPEREPDEFPEHVGDI